MVKIDLTITIVTVFSRDNLSLHLRLYNRSLCSGLIFKFALLSTVTKVKNCHGFNHLKLVFIIATMSLFA